MMAGAAVIVPAVALVTRAEAAAPHDDPD